MTAKALKTASTTRIATSDAMGRSGRMDEELLRFMCWRERLITEGFDAIEAFIAEYPAADPRELKRLIQKAQAMKRAGTPRFLLRYIRDLDEAKMRLSASSDPANQARVPPTVICSINSDG